METNIPIEQSIVQTPRNRKKHPTGKNIAKPEAEPKAKLADLDNGPMFSTSEILDFASGIDSTEYEQSMEH